MDSLGKEDSESEIRSGGSSKMNLSGTWDRYSEKDFSCIHDFLVRLGGIGGIWLSKLL